MLGDLKNAQWKKDSHVKMVGLGKNLLRSVEMFEALLYCLLFPWYHVCFEKEIQKSFLEFWGLASLNTEVDL